MATPDRILLQRIVQWDVDRHPRLVTLVRRGDPQSALVLRIGGVYSIQATAELAALLSSRLLVTTPNAEVSPDIGGVTLSVPIASDVSLRELVAQLDMAIRGKVSTAELERSTFRQQVVRYSQVFSNQVSASDRAFCLDRTEKPGDTNLDQLRQHAFVEGRARWGVVGSRDVVDKAESAIRALPAWPSAKATTPAWPAKDVSLIIPMRDRAPRIDITWRVPTARQTLATMRHLGTSSNLLAEVLSTLPFAMRVERAVATPLSIGGCVGLSLAPEAEGMAATTDDLLSAARIAVRELQRLSVRPGDEEFATLAVLDETDPRSAARLATMLSLSRDAESRSNRFRVEIDPGPGLSGLKPTPNQQRALASLAAPSPAASTVPLVQAIEPGQGNMIALLASPCANWDESARSAGSTGFLMRVLATRYHDLRGVTIEPWITANGVGLIAHTGRQSVQETPEEHAARLGDVLGRVLGTLRIDASDVWRTRSDLLATLGPGPRPALWRALTAFSLQQPGLVLPDGTHASVESISIADLRERRTRLMQMPLRLAVLGNENERQGEVLRESMMHWLSLVRPEVGQCPIWEEPTSLLAGEVRVQSRNPDSGDAAVTIAMTLPVADPMDEAHALLLLWLLNRPSGWLAERLRNANIVATVEARIVGGTRRRGLVVAIGAMPSVVDAAASSIRGLFQELSAASLPPGPSIARTISEMTRAERARRYNPRIRLEDLWLSRASATKVTERSMRDYLVRAFSSANLFLVRSQQTSVEASAGTYGKR